MESLRTIFFASSSSTHLLERLHTGLSNYNQDLSHLGPTSRMRSYVTFDEARAEDLRSKIATFTQELQSHSEAPGSDSSHIREIFDTMD